MTRNLHFSDIENMSRVLTCSNGTSNVSVPDYQIGYADWYAKLVNSSSRQSGLCMIWALLRAVVGSLESVTAIYESAI